MTKPNYKPTRADQALKEQRAIYKSVVADDDENSKNQRLLALLAEKKKRQTAAEYLDKTAFDRQLLFIKDTSKRKVLFTSRRAGKSTAIAFYLLQEALKFPGRMQLYIGLSREAAENTIWAIIQKELEKRNIQYSYNAVKKIITIRDNTIIKLAGMDNSPREMNKLLGGKYHMVCIDECQSFKQDLRRLIVEVIDPALTDYILDGGVILLAGTPGNLMGDHYWFQITRQTNDGSPHPERLKGWSIHSWTTVDNPFMKAQYFEKVKTIQDINPNYMLDPSFRKEWMGLWPLVGEMNVYRYSPEINLIKDQELVRSLISADKTKWQYLIGCDIGFEAPCAYVVGAWSKTDKRFFIVESKKSKHSVIKDIGSTLSVLSARYCAPIVLDTGGGGSKIVAESLRDQYNLPIQAAAKTEKIAHIQGMNSDFMGGVIQIIEDTNVELLKELNNLAWDPGSLANGIYKEGIRQSNHLTDAALYAWRDSKHFTANITPPTEMTMGQKIIQHQKKLNQPLRESSHQDYLHKAEEESKIKELIRRLR